jgi:hypothetical protein
LSYHDSYENTPTMELEWLGSDSRWLQRDLKT